MYFTLIIIKLSPLTDSSQIIFNATTTQFYEVIMSSALSCDVLSVFVVASNRAGTGPRSENITGQLISPADISTVEASLRHTLEFVDGSVSLTVTLNVSLSSSFTLFYACPDLHRTRHYVQITHGIISL